MADHDTEAREAVAAFDEVLTTILQAGLARAAVADHQDMRKICGWVAIVAVPTMIAGIYGMNFTNMSELETYGYFVVLGVIAVVMISLRRLQAQPAGSDVPRRRQPAGPGLMGPPARPRADGPTKPR